MRRKQDDKRVLRPGNGRQNNSKRRIRRSNKRNSFNRPLMSRGQSNNRRPKRQRKRSGAFVFMMIVALVAFVVGAAVGVSLSFDNDTTDEGPHYENVTKEMTVNLTNDTEQVYFDQESDDVDYNENGTPDLTIQYEYTSEN